MDDRPRRMRMALPFVAAGLLAVAAGCVALFAAKGGAAAGEVVQIGSDSGPVGASVTVRLEALNVGSPGVAAYTIDVTYDPAVIHPTACVADPNDLFNVSPLCNTAYPPLPSTVVRCVGASTTGVQGDVPLCDITFQIDAVGVSNLTLGVVEFADPAGAPIAPATTDGSITGLAATATPTPVTPTSTNTPPPPTATRTPTMTSTPCPEGICPSPTPAPTEHHVRARTHTPTPRPSATTAPETPVPTKIPQVTVVVPTSAPSGGTGPIVIAPLTGSGGGSSGSTAWTYYMAASALAALAAGGFAFVVRRRRHSQ